MLSRGTAFLNTRLKQACGETTTIRASNQSIDNIVAIKAKAANSDYRSEEIGLTGREQDWIYWAADLVIEGKQAEPHRGWEIDWIDKQGVKHTYEVLPRDGGDGARCFRPMETTQQQILVYTVEKRPSAE